MPVDFPNSADRAAQAAKRQLEREHPRGQVKLEAIDGKREAPTLEDLLYKDLYGFE